MKCSCSMNRSLRTWKYQYTVYCMKHWAKITFLYRLIGEEGDLGPKVSLLIFFSTWRCEQDMNWIILSRFIRVMFCVAGQEHWIALDNAMSGSLLCWKNIRSLRKKNVRLGLVQVKKTVARPMNNNGGFRKEWISKILVKKRSGNANKDRRSRALDENVPPFRKIIVRFVSACVFASAIPGGLKQVLRRVMLQAWRPCPYVNPGQEKVWWKDFRCVGMTRAWLLSP